MAKAAAERPMPWRRTGHTTAVTIGGERFYLTANASEDGTLGEVFIQWGKQGTTGAGLMDIYAIGLSAGLQHQVPLRDLIRTGLDLYFVPNGHTDDPDFPRVRSVADYIARRLAVDWLPVTERAALGIYTLRERVEQSRDWMAAQDPALAVPPPAAPVHTPEMSARPAVEAYAGIKTLLWELASGIGTPASTRP